MLVQFKVGNYLSFKDPQTLSLVASSDDRLPQNTFPVPGMAGVSLLKSIAVYGANASGKSNLLRALLFMGEFVLGSSSKRSEGDPIEVTPFKLDPACLDQPSEFEIVFIQEGERYTYGFTVDSKRVHEEWLTAAKIGSRVKPRLLFRRPESGKIEFGSSWRGRAQVLAEQTRPDALLLSVAAQLNNPTVKPVVEWFSDMLRSISEQPESHSEILHTLFSLSEDKAFASSLCELMKTADLGILGCRLEEVPFSDWFGFREVPEGVRKEILQQFSEDDAVTMLQPRTIHRAIDGSEVTFDLMQEESGGTKRFFALSGPWLTVLAQSLVLVVDELDRTLHPLMSRFLIETTHNCPNTPQLIFTTHDCTLLNADLFRRDQIWFTEKNKQGATQLYSLWDYKVRPDENYQGRYLQGRYGAVPYLGEWSFG